MAVLLTGSGAPAPPTEVVRRLQDISPLLDLRMVGVPQAGETVYWWGVISRWRATDPRWQMVGEGILTRDDAYDLVAQLPADCTADEAVGYLTNSVRQSDREDHRKILRDVQDWNTKVQRSLIAEGGDHMAELVKDNITEVANVTRVYQTERRTGKRAK